MGVFFFNMEGEADDGSRFGTVSRRKGGGVSDIVHRSNRNDLLELSSVYGVHMKKYVYSPAAYNRANTITKKKYRKKPVNN